MRKQLTAVFAAISAVMLVAAGANAQPRHKHSASAMGSADPGLERTFRPRASRSAVTPVPTTVAPTTTVALPPKRVVVQHVATPVPPKPAPTGPAEVMAAIHQAAAEFGRDEAHMRHTAWCESRYHADAVSGVDEGLFQQDRRYWADRVKQFNQRFSPALGGNIFNALDNARLSAWMMTQPGWQHNWPRCH